MTLADVVAQLRALELDATSSAASLWGAEIPGRRSGAGRRVTRAEAAGLDYFLEAELALKAAFASDAGTRFDRVLYYADNDAFLFELAVIHRCLRRKQQARRSNAPRRAECRVAWRVSVLARLLAFDRWEVRREPSARSWTAGLLYGWRVGVAARARASGTRLATADAACKDWAVERASRTAIVTAQFRAAHSLIDADPIFEDRFALGLADCSDADVRQFLAANVPDSCAHVARLFVAQRSRFVEEEVERAVSAGVDQYVDLGAGLNSFAWRRADLMARLAFFEVDHPATQEWKRARLAATGLECPPSLHFAGVDLTAAETLGERLRAAGFDPTRSSIWSWLGVIQYLALEAVESTLRAVAGLAAPGSKLVASYGVTDDLMEPASREFAALGRAFAVRVGEPQITWVPPSDIEAVARAAGWPRVSSVDPSSLTPWFAGRSDGLEPVRHEWLLVAEN